MESDGTLAPYDTDEGLGWRARLGVIVLSADETIEAELRQLINTPGVAVYVSRIAMEAEITPENLTAMAPRIAAAAALLPPVSVVGYACSSGATFIGADAVARAVRDGAGATVAVSDPLTAFVARCQALAARRLGLLTPYAADVAAGLRAALESAGLQIVRAASFGQASDRIVGRIAPESVLRAAIRVGKGCDAVIISCTNLRTAEILPAAEAALGAPVLSSNRALAWDMLRRAGVAADC